MRFSPAVSVRRALASILLLTATASVLAQTRPVPNPQLASKELNARVDALLKKMTLDEKIGQLVQFSAGFATGPGSEGKNQRFDEMVEKGQVGSFLNVVGADATNHYQHIAIEKSRLHIPLIFGLDVIHGHRTTFPIPLAVAASWDPAMGELVARTGAEEARADGIPWVFSPMVDIARDARWGRIIESNGEDPFLSSAMARAWVRGYQQGDLTKPDSVAVSVKHYAAYGAAIAGRDYNATDMSQITLRQVYLKPYQAAVEEGAATLMSSFNSINGVPATANPLTLDKILRKEWGFDGFVVSDWGAVAELINHSIGDGPTVARKALEAGVEMDMEGNLYGTTIAAQVRSGKIPEAVIDEAARRVLRVKYALGLFDHPFAQTSTPYQPTDEKRARARKVADETIVLLKNDPIEAAGTLLPLKEKNKTVALIGPMADDQPDMLGAWAAGDPKYVITLRKALEEKLGSDHVVYAQGCGLLNGQDAQIWSKNGGPQPINDENTTVSEAVEAAKKADVAVVALGEPAGFMEGEAGSRVNLGFTGNQQKLLEQVVATGKPVILVIAAGRPLEIKWAAEHVPAILEAWNPGFEAGHAIVDILTGDVTPSAKLPASLPRAVGQEPLYYAQMPTGRPAGTNDLTHMPANSIEKYLSRYVDEQNSALFPFGWGLSYTKFSYSTPTTDRGSVPVREVMAGGHKPVVKVGVDVRNTGSVAGTEVVQLYLRIPNVSVEQPLRELKGFTRVTLQPGESKHVEFPLGFDEMNFYNVDLKQVVEPTTYDIWVGGSSLADAHTTLKVVE